MSWLRDVDRWLCDEVVPYQYAYHALARRLTGNVEVARDIVQDVYAEVLAGEGWRDAINSKAYVLRIVYCRAVNWVNRQKVVPMQQLPAFETMVFADHEPDAFDTLADRQELAAVLDALSQLPRQCRQVVTMRRIDEMPPREIARRLGISLSTVEKHLAKGLVLLAEKLADRKPLRRTRTTQRRSAAEME